MKTDEIKIKAGQIWKYTGVTSDFFTYLVHYEVVFKSKDRVTVTDDDGDWHGWVNEKFKNKFEYVKG